MSLPMSTDQIKEPLVSVCCLAYNQEAFIAQTLEGMLMQKTDFPFEILIHDDASTDGTARIIADYAGRYPEIIRPLYETENQYSRYAAEGFTNISAIFNFPRARGRYLAMCEGDDYWNDETKLARQAAYMEAHPDCTLCFHSAHMLLEHAVAAEGIMRPYTSDRTVTPAEIIDKTAGYPMASMMLRKDAMMKLPEFYMKAPIGDIPIQLCMAAEGYGYYIDRPMATYRYSAAGSWTEDMLLSPDRAAKQERYAAQMKEMYEGFDSYTGGRWHEEVQRAARRLWYGTRVNLKDWSAVFAKENAAFFAELPRARRLLMRLEYRAPRLYRRLRELMLKRQRSHTS